MTDVIEPPVADHRGKADPRAEADSPAEAVPALTRDEAMALIERCETAARKGEPLTRSDALDVLRLSDADTVAAVSAAGRIRRARYGNTVKMNFLVNLKSGLCPEDCSYCSQRRGSEAGIMNIALLDADVWPTPPSGRPRPVPHGSAWWERTRADRGRDRAVGRRGAGGT